MTELFPYTLIGKQIKTVKEIWDVTENDPIPKNSIVAIEDFDSCGGETGIYIIEYDRKIYLADPIELGL